MRGLVDEQILVTDRSIPDKPPGDPEGYSDDTRLTELIKCELSPHYFIHNYVYIIDDSTRQWIQFRLYPAQINALDALLTHKYLILLKARQVGFSTLVGGAYFLWLSLFTDNALNLVLSKTEREAWKLMGGIFKPMYKKLPAWMRPAEDLSLANSKTEFELSNGSKTFSLPTSAGDSFTARACLLDEAALMHTSRTLLSEVLLAVEPTIDAGGQLILVSKADKSKPDSTFNSLFKAAIEGRNNFFPIFAPWQAVPRRNDEWYDSKVEFSKSINGTMDYVKENYPSSWQEALEPKELDKRLNVNHLRKCLDPMLHMRPDDLDEFNVPSLPGLYVYKIPEEYAQYIITADAAEGNPNSDDSTADVWDWDTGEQMANLSGKFEPSVFAQYIDLLGAYYKNAPVFPERNNHGHAVISWLFEHSRLRVLSGPDSTPGSKKFGYNTNVRAKASGFVQLADMLKAEEIIIHKETTFNQLVSVEGRTLRAPGKQNDDHAISAMLFAAAKKHVHLNFLLAII